MLIGRLGVSEDEDKEPILEGEASSPASEPYSIDLPQQGVATIESSIIEQKTNLNSDLMEPGIIQSVELHVPQEDTILNS